MKVSINANRCSSSPMRMYHPLAVAAKEAGKTIYHLNIGQPDLPTPPQFFDAIANFRPDALPYAPSPGIPILIDAIRDYYKTKLHVELDSNDVLITTGGSEALLMVCLSILDPYTEIIVPEPYYPNYTTFVHIAGGNIRALPTCPEEGYRYAFKERIEALISPNTRAIMFTNPGNPTGVTLSDDEMRMLAEVAKEHNLYLIADEVYREFCYGENAGVPTMGKFMDEIADNLIITDSVSKQFSTCGARIGCVITKNKELQKALMKFCQSRLAVATMDQVGAAALYSVGDDFYEANRAEYVRRRDLVYDRLKAIPGVLVTKPEGAFYIMAALPVDSTHRFQNWLLTDFEEDGDTVMFAPGAPFYETPGKGVNEVRIAYVLCLEDLSRAMDLLEKGIARYRKEVMGVE